MLRTLGAKSLYMAILIILLFLAKSQIVLAGSHSNKSESGSLEQLGEMLFSDVRLSPANGQACVSCHIPAAAFTDPAFGPSSLGADKKSFGNRNTPSIMYMKFANPLKYKPDDEDKTKMEYEGGLFWDGRANSLEEQAKGPLLNPVEMAATKEYVAFATCTSATYGDLFRNIFGSSLCDEASLFETSKQPKLVNQVEQIFDAVAKAIASFERTDQFAPFSSKFDKVSANLDKFTESEQRGFDQFKNEKTAKCVACHVLETDNSAGLPLFTDFTYDNIGVPVNQEIRARGHSAVDIGLAATTKREEDKGKFKVPTLRNIARTAPYMHNGYFKTLKQVVEFYNDRDVKAVCSGPASADEAARNNCWPAAEVPESMNREELGDLKLSAQDILDLVAFMETLNDGYWAPKQPVSR